MSSAHAERRKNWKFTHVFPSQRCFTALAINVGDCVQSCQQNPFLGWTATNIHPARKTNPKRPWSSGKRQPNYQFTTDLSEEYTYTLLNKYALPWLPWNDWNKMNWINMAVVVTNREGWSLQTCETINFDRDIALTFEMSSSWFARWARQWMQLYVLWQWGR